MSRLRQADIVCELVELCNEVMGEIRQQLVYYRASVYKDETAALVQRKVDQLRMIVGLLGDDLVQEPIRDYDAMLLGGVANYVPGECSFSTRLTCLLTGLTEQLERVQRNSGGHPFSKDFARSVQRHRRQLLAMCRQGSRQWAFFQTV